MVKCINDLPCKSGLAGLIPCFSSLLNETLSPMTLAFGGTLNTNMKMSPTDVICCNFSL